MYDAARDLEFKRNRLDSLLKIAERNRKRGGNIDSLIKEAWRYESAAVEKRREEEKKKKQ